MKDIRPLAQATLELAAEIRREMRLPEKFRAEKVLEEILKREEVTAAVARATSGRGSASDIAIAQETFKKATK